ncbi:MAG: TlpA disulfide reductase family protein [Bacteroidia bacterium]
MKTRIFVISVVGIVYMISSSFMSNNTVNSFINGKAKINADTLDLSQFKNKILIVNFWASWSKASRSENKNLVRIYELYKNNTNVKFVSISLDLDKNSWQTAISEDEMVWKDHFCDFKKYDSPFAKQFSIITIPVFKVFNLKGELMSTSSNTRELEKTIAQALK